MSQSALSALETEIRLLLAETSLDLPENTTTVGVLTAPARIKVRKLQLLMRQKRAVLEELEFKFASLGIAYDDGLIGILRRRVELRLSPPLIRGTAASLTTKFGSRIVEYYGGTDPECQMVTCAVTGTSFPPGSDFGAMYLVPPSLECHELNYLFGDDEVDTEDERNTLIVQQGVFTALNLGKLAIVPYIDQYQPFGWRCTVLDSDILNKPITPLTSLTYGDVDGKRLHFKNANWPSERYLCFRYLMSIVMSRFYNPRGWLDQAGAIGSVVWWSVRTTSLRKSCVLAIGAQVGSDCFPEALQRELTFTDGGMIDGRLTMTGEEREQEALLTARVIVDKIDTIRLAVAKDLLVGG